MIKCGAFDQIENKSREEIMKDFISTVADQKQRLTMQNANMLIDYNLVPSKYDYQSNVYKLTKELRKNRDEDKLWYCGDRISIPAGKLELWRQIIRDSKVKTQTIVLNSEDRKVLSSASWDIFYESQMSVIKSFIKANSEKLLQELNQKLYQEEYDKYALGDKLQWELDSLNFFFDGHPLENVVSEISSIVAIDRLDNIVEGAQDGEFYIKGKIIPKMKLYSIIGTVIDREKVKGIVTLQTPDGIVNMKVYKDLFALYNQTLSSIDGDNKTIIQDSFFEKGTHLLVTGVQRGVVFVPKVYKNIKRRPIMKINLKDSHFSSLEEKKEGLNNAVEG